MYDYFLSSALSRYDVTSSYGKRKISDEFLPVLLKIDNPIVQGHYIRKLASGLGLSEEMIQGGLSKYRTSGGTSLREKVLQNADKQQTLTRLERAEVYLAALMVHGKTAELLQKSAAVIPVADLGYLPVKRIMEKLEEYLRTHAQ